MGVPEKKRRRRRRKSDGASSSTDQQPLVPAPDSVGSWKDRILSEFDAVLEQHLSQDVLYRRLIPRKNRVQRKMVDQALDELIQAGTLLRLPDSRMALPRRLLSIIGRLDANRDGYGFVIDPEGKKDVFVPAHYLRGAIDGDTVRCYVTGEDARGRREGMVWSVQAHGRRELPGLLMKTGDGFFVRPRDVRIRHLFRVEEPIPSLPEDGETIVVLSVTVYPDESPVPSGRITSVLGMEGDPSIDTDLVIASFGLPLAFPRDIEEAAGERASSVPIAPSEGRTDLRPLNIVTIDGDSARDFDDAISLESGADGTWTLGIHIADVSTYVLPGSPLDREAFARATSVYFPDRVVPMFPEVLSNGVLSLNPDEDRLARSVIVQLDHEGTVLDWRVEPSVIRSRKRMTYSEVHRALTGTPSEDYRPWLDLLKDMWNLALRLRRRRMDKGSLDFDLPEPEIVLDLRGEPVDILRSPRYLSHQLIEEFMLLANTLVASRLSQRLGSAIFRAHEPPSPERIDNLYAFLNSLGISLARPESVTPRDLSLILEKTKGSPVEHPIHYAVLRSLKQARYDERPMGHFGLAFSDYTHFTSPIRRYPDLIVHRLLTLTSSANKEGLLPASLSVVAQHCSERERKATEAERMAVDFKKVRFMSRHLGESFDGRITGVAAYGLFVELAPFFVEGLIPIHQIGKDYFEYREDRHQIRGERTGKSFSVGDSVRVTVAKVDFQRLRCDFVLEEEAADLEKPHAYPRKRKGGRRGR